MTHPDSQCFSEVQPGQILAGKFRIEEILGQGGMGVVVAATHIQLQERVALKFLLPEALKNSEAVHRFEREARAAVKIKSEHVARVTDVGTLESGAPYMVMEYLNGMDLGQYLELTGPLAIDEAVQYVLQACEAIAEAHAAGIIHRDLKPANLFRIIRSDGTPSIKVLDFGISKFVSKSDPSMTQTSMMMGSPYYMSPEQMTSSKTVDGRTDVWSLGIILHELLTGRVPYQGDTIPELCVQVLQGAAPKLKSLRADAPDGLELTIDRALTKDRDARFPDVADFSASLSAYGGDDAERSVRRISKVLGVTLTERCSPPTGRAVGTLATENPNPEEENAPRQPTKAATLAGAAHTLGDYHVPTRGRSKAPLYALLLLLLVSGGVLALNRSNGPSRTASQKFEIEGTTSAATPEGSPAAQSESSATIAEDSPVSESKTTADDPPKSAELPLFGGRNKEASVDPVPLPQRTPAAAHRPPRAQPRPQPRPPKPTLVSPPPQPAPTPKPAPQPQPAPPEEPSNLYEDRQ